MIDPRGMKDAREWADFVTIPLNSIGVTPRRLDNAENWKSWAFNLIQSAQLAGLFIPDPRFFDDWMEWAFRFNQAVNY